MLAPFWADRGLGESGAVHVQAFANSVVVQWETYLPAGEACHGGARLVDRGALDGAHGSNADCTWALRCSDASQTPALSFSAFSTESDYDHVRVFDGADASATELGAFHGDTTVRARAGRLSARSVSQSRSILYVRARRLTARNGGFRRG